MTTTDYDTMNRLAETLFNFAYNDASGARREACVEAADSLRNAAEEIHWLRALVDDASHEVGCDLDRPEAEIRPTNKCTCWKAEA